MHWEPTTRDQREGIVVVALAGVFGVAGFLVLLVIGGMLFIDLLAVALGMALLGGLHYLLWGRALSRHVERPCELAALCQGTDGAAVLEAELAEEFVRHTPAHPRRYPAHPRTWDN